MARIKITKRVKLSSQIVSNTETTTPVSSITVIRNANPVTPSAKPVSLTQPELFNHFVDKIQTRIRLHDADVSICQDSRGKRKQDSTDDNGTNRDTSVARKILAKPDTITLEADDDIRHEEAIYMSCMDQELRELKKKEEEEETLRQLKNT
jgi:hypothetical protein